MLSSHYNLEQVIIDAWNVSLSLKFQTYQINWFIKVVRDSFEQGSRNILIIYLRAYNRRKITVKSWKSDYSWESY